MAELSEEQLLVLSNFAYYTVPSGGSAPTSMKAVVDEILYYSDNCIARDDLSSEIVEFAKVIKEDPSLYNLRIDSICDENSVYAVCFVDNDGEATVAVRGSTGYYEPWSDNVQGEYSTGTECQEILRNYVHDVGQRYGDITITGHSKGGNMAQYATITEGEYIDRCVSFDGQGFNQAFIDKYSDEIEQNRDKIKCINAYNDYVSPFLIPIAGTTVYLFNEAGGFDAHSPYYLWESNRYTQVNGEYSQLVDRDQSINVFDFAVDTLTTGISFLPDYIEYAFVNAVASGVGLLFAIKDGHGISDLDLNDMISSFVGLVYSFNPLIQIQQAFQNVFNFFNNLINGNNADSSEQYSSTNRHSDFYIKLKQLHGASMNLDSISRNCKIIVNELKGVPLEQLLVYSSIITVKNSLESTVREIDSLSVALSNISDLYSNTEHSISAMIR